MGIDRVMEVIKDLAKHQGLYARLLKQIEGYDDRQKEAFKVEMESQNFEDPVDVIMYFEC